MDMHYNNIHGRPLKASDTEEWSIRSYCDRHPPYGHRKIRGAGEMLPMPQYLHVCFVLTIQFRYVVNVLCLDTDSERCMQLE